MLVLGRGEAWEVRWVGVRRRVGRWVKELADGGALVVHAIHCWRRQGALGRRWGTRSREMSGWETPTRGVAYSGVGVAILDSDPGNPAESHGILSREPRVALYILLAYYASSLCK